jgi:hypothetical protein
LSAVYVFIPEPTDLIPILGWLDEATAITIFSYALKQLNIDLFDKFSLKKTKSVKTIIKKKTNEKILINTWTNFYKLVFMQAVHRMQIRYLKGYRNREVLFIN